MVQVAELNTSDESEALEFLAQRPIHTVGMVGFIHDNGLVSPLNRGTFYGCRNRQGKLEGVALIGHATLLETTTDRALEALAQIAQTCTSTHMIMGEKERIDDFWSCYAGAGQEMRRACRELLFELRWPVEALEEISGLRLATAEDIELTMPIQARMAFDESGVNPLERDPEGFRQRCARRIEQGRTWVWIENGELIFKAEVLSDTSSVIYLEGVWINTERRSQGYGLRCMSQLARTLLSRTRSLCVLVNENNKEAHTFYQRAGYRVRSIYDTIFMM
ncbi:MAG: GNAT family N-acetyltransferase [Acidobacteriota bacterium]|nr:GNAT family N-acetyltransferase [Acidobacteriota bacterium]